MPAATGASYAALDALHPSLAPVAFIHDAEWSESENAPNAESNARFRRNGVKVAYAAYGWWRPRRYKVMWDAWKFARICQRFGWSALRAPYDARQEGISPEAEGRAAKQALAGCVLMARPSPTGLATSTSRSSHGEWSGTAHQPQQEKSTMNGKINTPRTVCKAIVAVAIAAIVGIRPRRRRRVYRTK